jgi:ADP-ribose pyrophosphatase YjhB (NUDIX family)
MSNREDMALRLLRWANNIKAIAETGLSFAADQNDSRRYEELRGVAIQMFAAVNGKLEVDVEYAEELAQALRRETRSGVLGYVTPKVCVAAAVFDGNSRLLLVKSNHSGVWSLPGGWAEEHWTPAENARREVLEETGLVVGPRHLLGVFDSRLHPFETTVTSYTLLFECQYIDGELQVAYDEIERANYFPQDSLPPLITGAEEQVRVAFAFHNGFMNMPYFDE